MVELPCICYLGGSAGRTEDVSYGRIINKSSSERRETVKGHKNITAESGKNVTLTCRAPNNNIVVEWSRADLQPEYVLLYQDKLFIRDHQHPSFKNRVDLQDKQMKDGDVSLILKDVMVNDTGTYECRVFVRETRSWKITTIIHLSVDPPGQPGGHTEDGQEEDGVGRSHHGRLMAADLLLTVIILVFAVVISKKHKKDPPLQPPDEEAKKEMV